MFTLPMAILSIALFFVSTSMLIWNTFLSIARKITEIQSIGWDWHWSGFRLDWFFLNTDSKIFLAIILFVATIVLITFGKKISEKKIGFSIHTFYFPFVYTFFTIFWLSKAVYNTALAKETKWR
jgi:hypothetical protein